MKKLILSVVIVLSSLSIYAKTMTSELIKGTMIIQDTYTEVSLDAVPAAVKTALQAAYPEGKLDKAFVNEKKEYKLEISVGDQKATVYSDANGNWLKI